jgi:hypothetical protein
VGYAMIWIEGLAAAGLLVATITALVARLTRRWLQIVLIALAALFPLAAGLCFTVPMGMLIRWMGPAWFTYGLSWTILIAGGAVGVACLGLRRRGAEPVPAASAWPRGKLAVALAAVAVLFVMTFWNMDLAMQNRLGAVRSQAGALALSVAPARVPDADNAAPIYREAFIVMNQTGDRPPEWKEEWTAWIGQDDAAALNPADPALLAYLKTQEPALALLREAAGMSGCYFDRDYGRPSVSMLLPELGHFRNAAYLLALSARAGAAAGNVRPAFGDIQAILRMGKHVQSEPLLISALVAMAVDRAAVKTLEGVLESGDVKADDLSGVRLRRSQFYNHALGRAFRMEEAFGTTIFADINRITGDELREIFGSGADVGMTFPGGASLGLMVWRVFLLPADLDFYSSGLRDYQNLTSLPFHEAREWRETLKNRLETDRSGMGLISAMLFPALSACSEKAAQADAGHGLARLGLAAARYRAEMGACPKTLEELTPKFIAAIPPDPFDGKPLRMVTRDGAVIFYSIASDMKDDGGAPWDGQEKSGDLTFRLGPAAPKPPPQAQPTDEG